MGLDSAWSSSAFIFFKFSWSFSNVLSHGSEGNSCSSALQLWMCMDPHEELLSAFLFGTFVSTRVPQGHPTGIFLLAISSVAVISGYHICPTLWASFRNILSSTEPLGCTSSNILIQQQHDLAVYAHKTVFPSSILRLARERKVATSFQEWYSSGRVEALRQSTWATFLLHPNVAFVPGVPTQPLTSPPSDTK